MKYNYSKAANPVEFSKPTGLAAQPLDFKTLAKDIPCQAACPAKTDVPKYIEQIALGNPGAAYRINLEDNVFPGVLGRVCTRPCEDACRHNWTNTAGAVSICHLKRGSADGSLDDTEPLSYWFPLSGKNIAVIGGGPAGLTAARELRRYGHEVTLFERGEHLGGMMVDGIPKFRLPRETIDKEISLIVDSGIDVKLNQNIDSKQLEQLEQDYDAVLLAVGTTVPRELRLGDEAAKSADDILDGLKFMKDYNDDKITDLKGDVIVIGGGFTAVDASRSSARAARKLLGSEHKVSIFYRRTEHHMAAELEEMDEIRMENIEIRTLASPKEAVYENGKLIGVKFIRNKIGDGEVDGKISIEEIPGSEFIETCDHLIVAIGQTQEWDILPEGASLEKGQKTNRDKLFVAGDFATGSQDVIHAVADGKAAADTIDQALMGRQRIKKHVSIELGNEDGETIRVRDHDLQKKAAMPLLDLHKRAMNNAEVEQGYENQDLLSHATRCYLCQYKFEIDSDKCIHCDWCIDVAPRDCIKKVSRVFKDEDNYVTGYTETDIAAEATFIHIDSDECIRCGKCIRVCPVDAISMVKANLTKCAQPVEGGDWIEIHDIIKETV